MLQRAVLIVALLAPSIVHPEELFRWRDARGRLHYSNDPQSIPEGATPVTRRIGEIGGEPVGAAVEPPPPAVAPEPPVSSPWAHRDDCLDDLGLLAFPHRPVDLDRRSWFDVDQACGRQWDVESWLRGATTVLERRKVGL